MQFSVRDLSGEVVENIEISDSVFGVAFNEAVVHQVMVGQRANARQGTASTMTRGEVAGSTRKLFRQKGTGQARAGSIKSPLRRGGGTVFGPMPRSYRQATPKKVRQLALRCVLSAKVRDDRLVVVNELKQQEPKTRAMVKALEALGIGESVLIADVEADGNLVKSVRNIPHVSTIPARLLNVVDLLSHNKVLMTVAALRQAEQLWGEKTHATV